MSVSTYTVVGDVCCPRRRLMHRLENTLVSVLELFLGGVWEHFGSICKHFENIFEAFQKHVVFNIVGCPSISKPWVS